MNSYVWKIEALERVATLGKLSNVITTVHWRLQVTGDGGASDQSVYGDQSLPVPEEIDFIPYNTAKGDRALLTDWLTAAMGEDTVTFLKSRADEALSLHASPKVLIDRVNL